MCDEQEQMLRNQIAELEKKLLHSQACQLHTLHFASYALDKAGTDRFMGSGIILQMHGYNGKELFAPVCIKDGLSEDTIKALQADLARSYRTLTEFKPRGATDESQDK